MKRCNVKGHVFERVVLHTYVSASRGRACRAGQTSPQAWRSSRAMGNFLDTPITEKKTEIGADGKLQYGLSAMQGWRAQMEDDHVQLLSLPGVIPALGIARL